MGMKDQFQDKAERMKDEAGKRMGGKDADKSSDRAQKGQGQAEDRMKHGRDQAEGRMDDARDEYDDRFDG
ncbi:hypothetical protein [Streptomyces sp. NRRL F-5126]|uniref:hypothetical protein n=1 Tax=Streptomyces sp. NRRL F-5126 TaxID=1463857 RepID=UPI0004C5C098|nr:hypothetical protein [Streptomyces sp. NRRL F-5126]